MTPHFNLQNVLDVRHRKVEALEVELSRLMMEQLNIQTLLVSLRDLQKSLMQQMTGAMVGEIDMFTISVVHANILHVTEHIARVEQDIEKINIRVEHKRKELVEAKQAEETLSILKEKRVETYKAEQAQIESRQQDDIYISQAFRQQHQEV
ncbi:MAG: flagellar export protein FliJ [Anaerolineaceae bacterium]|nr:flagellar export protein FliJ [Anaerolineaceae bacterium]